MVRFDDRLQTVLRQPASDQRDAAVRWRQLVDLIARAGPGVDSNVLDDALIAIREDSKRIDESLRAAAARAIAALPLPFGLLEYFVAERLTVSAPILAAASLDRGQWTALVGLADRETRRFVETLHPELCAPDPAIPERLTEQFGASERVSISEVVARIERRRHRRPEWSTSEAAVPRATPEPAELSVFRWECGPSGEIGWVEGAPRGALIGRSIARARDSGGDRIEEAAVRAFNQRAPFRDAEMMLAGDGAVAGSWKISGVPAFDAAEGRFAGYRGIALRESARQHALRQQPLTAPPLPVDSDSLRELVHEIKTPLNAIIGFAEIIDGQYLGPAGRRYRQRATAIVAQARLLLDAIDDLDHVARLRSQASGPAEPTDVVAAVAGAVNALRQHAEKDGIELVHAPPNGAIEMAADGPLLRRLVERVLASAVGLSSAGERLRVTVDRLAGRVHMKISRPRALLDMESVGSAANGDEMLGPRFSLHLARGLARIAGGDLLIEGDWLVLILPPA